MMNDLILLGTAGVLLVVLFLWQRKDDAFDLRWLLVDTTTHKVSIFKVGQLIALWASTWALISMTRKANLTDSTNGIHLVYIYAIYLAVWSGANIVNKIVEKYDFTRKP